MIHDKKLLGVCGETEFANAKDDAGKFLKVLFNWHGINCLLQVYEYFISHHMAKAFECLFGSVTCLPGCFDT